MQRRDVLRGTGLGSAFALAGCVGTLVESQVTTGTPEDHVHDVGETFTVQAGDQPARYRVVEWMTTESISTRDENLAADGTFLVVRLEVENVGSEPATRGFQHFVVRDGNDDGHGVNLDITVEATRTTALDLEPIPRGRWQPDERHRGILIFDVPASATDDLTLLVNALEPTQTDDRHYVRLTDSTEPDGGTTGSEATGSKTTAEETTVSETSGPGTPGSETSGPGTPGSGPTGPGG
jgi:hypothetical protein